MKHRFARALVYGNVAGLLSAAVLGSRGRVDAASALAPLNAPSHWLYGQRALRQRRASVRHTLAAALIHQASSVLWAWFFVPLAHGRSAWRRAAPLSAAVAVTAAAALVDLKVVPERFTPGFERHLSAKSLGLVYAAFGCGLALSAWCMGEPPEPHDGRASSQRSRSASTR